MPNYYVNDDGIAYFNDGGMIDRLTVSNLPRNAIVEDLLEYFGSFGKIEGCSIKVMRTTNMEQNRVGFLNFTDPKLTAAVLQATHAIKDVLLNITPYSSAAQELSSDSSSSYDEEETTDFSNEGNMLSLNDDCLYHILEYLSIGEQVRFAITCQRMLFIYQMYSIMKYKIVSLDKVSNLSLVEMHTFLKIAGPYIKDIYGGMEPCTIPAMVVCLAKFCNNVQALDIHSAEVELEQFVHLLNNMKKIVVLDLGGMDVTDPFVKHLPVLKKLRILRIEDNYDISGRYLYRLNTLEELYISGCENIQSVYLTQALKSMPKLKTLNIQHIYLLHLDVFFEMVNTCKRLETLRISYNENNCEIVGALQSLKHLEINTDKPIKLKLFQLLTEHQCQRMQCLYFRFHPRSNYFSTIDYDSSVYIAQLQYLKILSCPKNDSIDDKCLENFSQLKHLRVLNVKYCQTFSCSALLHLIKSCQNLQFINLKKCHQLRDSLVYEIIKVLKAQEERKHPLVMLVEGSGISTNVIHESIYKANASLLVLMYNVANINADEAEEPWDSSDCESQPQPRRHNNANERRQRHRN